MSPTTIEVPLEMVLELRQKLLRPDKAPRDLISSADMSPTALHLAAQIDGEMVGMLSAGPEDCPFRPWANSWRLRGLAVVEPARRKGVATLLLKAIIAGAYARGAGALWGMTRVAAVPAHVKLGFETIGDEYEIAPAGLHQSTFVRLTADYVETLRQYASV